MITIDNKKMEIILLIVLPPKIKLFAGL